jgi:glycosyltransferase involved in cell wall biosynthesis
VHDVGLALFEPLPRELFYLRRVRKQLARELVRIDAARRYDLVIINHQSLLPLLPAARSGRWVAHFQNAAAQRARQTAATYAGARQRWIYQREAAKAERLERWAVGSYDAVVTCSEEDADELTGVGRERAIGPVIVTPNGVDTARFTPSPLPAEPRLIMTATFNYLPNVDGARWFVDQVFPKIQAAVPSVVLDLVGRQPVPTVLDLAARPGVAVQPNVPAIAPYLAAARVAVAPLRMGTGTRLKALEAMAAARPIAGTTIGLDGLGLVDGVNALIADDADTLAGAIVALLSDDTRALAIATAGRRLVEDRYEWDALGERFADALLRLVG